MTTQPAGPTAADLRQRLRHGISVLAQPTTAPSPQPHLGTGVTSDLSIDEVLLLHGAGWEPMELVCGVAICSVPAGAWVWGQGEILAASEAHNRAVAMAAARMQQECAQAGGAGVVGVKVEVSVHPHHVDVELVGTAVRPIPNPSTGVGQRPGSIGQASGGTSSGGTQLPGASGREAQSTGGTSGQRPAHSRRPVSGHLPFVSDLSARDFVLLRQAGWFPVALVFGASFVYAPRRSMGAAISQKNQNVELTILTEALYASREAAMERMQAAALRVRANGVVAVSITEGQVAFAHHAVGFTTWGTAVRMEPSGHRRISPKVVLSLNDAKVLFQATSMRH